MGSIDTNDTAMDKQDIGRYNGQPVWITDNDEIGSPNEKLFDRPVYKYFRFQVSRLFATAYFGGFRMLNRTAVAQKH